MSNSHHSNTMILNDINQQSILNLKIMH